MDINVHQQGKILPVLKQDLFLISNKVFVTTNFIHEYGISFNKVYKRKYNTVRKGYAYWKTIAHPIDSRRKLIEYKSIPEEFVLKHKLPNKWDILKILYNERQEIKLDEKKKRISIIKVVLDFAYEVKFKKVRQYYANELISTELIDEYSKTAAVLSSCIGLRDENHAINEIYEVYRTYQDLTFFPSSYNSFANKLKSIKSGLDVKTSLLHGLRNKVSNNLKLTDDVIIEIKRLYSNPKKLNAHQITHYVNEYLLLRNRKCISQKTVEKVMSLASTKNECMYGRYQKSYTDLHLVPQMRFIPPSKAGELWLMDGSRFQFIYKTHDKKFNFLTFFVVMDGYSRKILGYSYDSSENGEMVKVAFEKACQVTRYLPTEIIHDNSSAIKKGIFNEIRNQSDSWGVFWRPTSVGNSKDNAYVERFFGIFQEKYCKKVTGYIGEGITSSRLDGRPSKEELAKLSRKKNIRTKDELINLLEKLINIYNHTPGKNKLSPFEVHKNASISEVINLTDDRYTLLFWIEKKVTVQSSMISFYYEKEEYVYIIKDHEIRNQINGVQINIRFNPTWFKTIFIFNIRTKEFITSVNRTNKIPKSRLARSEDDSARLNRHIKLKKEVINYLKRQQLNIEEQSKKNWERIPPEISEYGIVSKKDRTKSEDVFWDETLEPRNRRIQPEEELELNSTDSDDTGVQQVYNDLYNF